MSELEADFEPLRTTATTLFESASQFGLTRDEIWETGMETLDRLPEETRAAYIEDLAAALAARLLEKERRLL